jgi:hypothetical protein
MQAMNVVDINTAEMVWELALSIPARLNRRF